MFWIEHALAIRNVSAIVPVLSHSQAPQRASLFRDFLQHDELGEACCCILLSFCFVVDDEQIRLVFERVNDSKFEN